MAGVCAGGQNHPSRHSSHVYPAPGHGPWLPLLPGDSGVLLPLPAWGATPELGLFSGLFPGEQGPSGRHGLHGEDRGLGAFVWEDTGQLVTILTIIAVTVTGCALVKAGVGELPTLFGVDILVSEVKSCAVGPSGAVNSPSRLLISLESTTLISPPLIGFNDAAPAAVFGGVERPCAAVISLIRMVTWLSIEVVLVQLRVVDGSVVISLIRMVI